MVTLFYLSYAALWVLLLIEGVLILLIYRHFGMVTLGTAEGVQRDGLPIGETAPAIRGSTAAGMAQEWLPHQGQPQLVLFATPDCAPCAQVLPAVSALAEHGLEIVTVVPGRRDGVVRLIEKFRPPFLCLADEERRAVDRYRVRTMPFAFVIGNDGHILAKGLCGDPWRLRLLLTKGGLHGAAAALAPLDKSLRKSSGATAGKQEVLP